MFVHRSATWSPHCSTQSSATNSTATATTATPFRYVGPGRCSAKNTFKSNLGLIELFFHRTPVAISPYKPTRPLPDYRAPCGRQLCNLIRFALNLCLCDFGCCCCCCRGLMLSFYYYYDVCFDYLVNVIHCCCLCRGNCGGVYAFSFINKRASNFNNDRDT